LASGTPAEIQQMFNVLSDQSTIIIRSVMEMIYYFRGAITYDEGMLMSPFERTEAVNFINSHLEKESKKQNPIY
jgi:hypothetical protein